MSHDVVSYRVIWRTSFHIFRIGIVHQLSQLSQLASLQRPHEAQMMLVCGAVAARARVVLYILESEYIVLEGDQATGDFSYGASSSHTSASTRMG